MKTSLLFLSMCALVGTIGCAGDQGMPKKAAAGNPPHGVLAGKFTPPSDSSISSVQMKNWLACNQLLDSLTYLYADSFKTESAAKRLEYQEAFSKAQDRICALTGLHGGYKEYRWIMDNMGNPRNKAVLDSSHSGVY